MTPATDPVAAYLRLWHELDALPDAEFEGVAGEAIRDRSDPLWVGMTDEQRRQVRVQLANPNSGGSYQ